MCMSLLMNHIREDILKGTEEGIYHPEMVIPEDEEDDEPTKVKKDSPNEVDNLPLLGRLPKTIHSTTLLEISPKA